MHIFGLNDQKNNLSKSTSFITHKYINNTTLFNKPSECRLSAITIYPRLFGTRLIGTRPTETRLIGTLKIDRVQLERVSLARNRWLHHIHPWKTLNEWAFRGYSTGWERRVCLRQSGAVHRGAVGQPSRSSMAQAIMSLPPTNLIISLHLKRVQFKILVWKAANQIFFE